MKTFIDEIENFDSSKSQLLSEQGRYIGPIETHNKHVKTNIHKIFNDEGKLSHIILDPQYVNYIPKSNIVHKFNVIKLTSYVPIILDIMKIFFHLCVNNSFVGEIESERYIFFRNMNEIPLSEFMKYKNDKQVNYLAKRILAFHWLMGLKKGFNSSSEQRIYVKNLNPATNNVFDSSALLMLMSYDDNDYIRSPDINIPRIMINKWYGGKIQNFYDVCRELLCDINVETFRNILKDTIIYYDPDLISWVNIVYERMSFIKGLFE